MPIRQKTRRSSINSFLAILANPPTDLSIPSPAVPGWGSLTAQELIIRIFKATLLGFGSHSISLSFSWPLRRRQHPWFDPLCLFVTISVWVRHFVCVWVRAGSSATPIEFDAGTYAAGGWIILFHGRLVIDMQSRVGLPQSARCHLISLGCTRDPSFPL